MTQEQDIVERLENPNYAKSPTFAASYMREAAQTIAALRVKYDDLTKLEFMTHSRAQAAESKVRALRAELARRTANPADYRYWEGRWRDTQAECDNAIRERDEARAVISDNVSAITEAQQLITELVTERDEARKALRAIENLPSHSRMDDMENVAAMRDIALRARSASSNREGGEE